MSKKENKRLVKLKTTKNGLVVYFSDLNNFHRVQVNVITDQSHDNKNDYKIALDQKERSVWI